jgi:hypothetical protein
MVEEGHATLPMRRWIPAMGHELAAKGQRAIKVFAALARLKDATAAVAERSPSSTCPRLHGRPMFPYRPEALIRWKWLTPIDATPGKTQSPTTSGLATTSVLIAAIGMSA